jgi:hypothetical protein
MNRRVHDNILRFKPYSKIVAGVLPRTDLSKQQIGRENVVTVILMHSVPQPMSDVCSTVLPHYAVRFVCDVVLVKVVIGVRGSAHNYTAMSAVKDQDTIEWFIAYWNGRMPRANHQGGGQGPLSLMRCDPQPLRWYY